MMKLSTCRTGLRLALLLSLVAVGASRVASAEPLATPQQSLIAPDPSLSWLERVDLCKHAIGSCPRAQYINGENYSCSVVDCECMCQVIPRDQK
jgi:hypothetical protein